jgi:hypothetical protein
MTEERSFVWGYRTAHCVKGIAMFLAAVALNTWYAVQAQTTFVRVIPVVIGAFFIHMTFLMTRFLVSRLRGKRRIVVGARTLTSPTGVLRSQRDVEIPYGEMRDVIAAGGEKGKLQIQHRGGTLEIERTMLGTDGEFDELVGVIRKRLARV